jgi:hypothetical protein
MIHRRPPPPLTPIWCTTRARCESVGSVPTPAPASAHIYKAYALMLMWWWAQCWEQAANLAINHQRHRMHDVVGLVSERLVEIGRHQAAAELFEGVDDLQGMAQQHNSSHYLFRVSVQQPLYS